MYDFFIDNYNTTIVLITTLVLGVSSGLIGTFLVLRKQALLSDAITHSTLPGIGIGFLIAFSLDLNGGRFLPLLLGGAAFTSYLGAMAVKYINNHTRLSPDTAIASVMSIFYAGGLMILSIIQNLGSGQRAGLNHFLLGQVSGLTINDMVLLSCVSFIVIMVICCFFKNFRLLCFDYNFANLTGQRVTRTDNLFLALTILVICTGLRTVGLILIIALLIVPAMTARLWTRKTEHMALLSALIGGLSCTAGVFISSDLYDLPTGSTIVIVTFAGFVISLILQPLMNRHMVPHG